MLLTGIKTSNNYIGVFQVKHEVAIQHLWPHACNNG